MVRGTCGTLSRHYHPMSHRPLPPPASASGGFLKSLGPGLVTGASDDDPSGIATYSQAGAQFGYRMLWTMVLIYPFMVAIQEISALIGRVTGRGIAGNMRRYYSKWVAYPVVLLLLVANTINLAADINAMGAAVQLVVGGPAQVYGALLALVSVVLEIRVSYLRYSNILKWLTLSLFAYVATVFAVHIDWGAVLQGCLIPRFTSDAKFLVMLIALLGTTISPYLFFWQSSAEAEEVQNNDGQEALRHAPQQARAQIRRIRSDTYVGMAASNIISLFIMVTVAATLHAQGVTEIDTAAQAAEALRPLAGRLAFLLFTLGIVGTGMLALPVLAGSAAYAVGETLSWPIGLERKARAAKGFYSVIAVATLVAVAMNFTHLDPIKALFWTAVVNGVIAVPLMVVMMFMTSNRNVMGQFTLSRSLSVVGWLATAIMLAASLGLFFSWGS